MAKKLLGSGKPKGQKQKLPATVGTHNVSKGEIPWVDPEKARAAKNAGGAGVALHKELKKSQHGSYKGLK